MKNYNHLIISELNFITNTPDFGFFDKALTEKIQQKMLVRSNKEFLKNNVQVSKKFRNAYGKMRYEEACNKMGLFYYFNFPNNMVKQLKNIRQKIIDNNDISTKKMVDNIYGLFFKKIQDNLIVLSTAIWMVKDSCVQENHTYLFANTGYENTSTILRDYSLANGEHGTIELSNSELNKVKEYYNLLMPIMLRDLKTAPKKNYSSEIAYTIEVDALDRSKESSFIRALVALQNARSSSQLPVKIDFYIQLLQCIYGLEGKSHNIKRMLEKYTVELLNLNNKEASSFRENLDKIKSLNSMRENIIASAFNIRSKQTHGNKINYDNEIIKEVAIQLDEYVREVLKIVLPKKELDYSTKSGAKKVNKYFHSLAKK